MFLDGNTKPESSEESHTYIGERGRLHIHRGILETEPTTVTKHLSALYVNFENQKTKKNSMDTDLTNHF